MREFRAGQNPLAPFSEVPPRVFETERLRLRALTLADLSLMFEIYTGDPLATKYMAWPRATAPEDGHPFLQLIDSSFSGVPVGVAQFAWLIQLKTTGEFLGSCGIGADQDMSARWGIYPQSEILGPRIRGGGFYRGGGLGARTARCSSY